MIPYLQQPASRPESPSSVRIPDSGFQNNALYILTNDVITPHGLLAIDILYRARATPMHPACSLINHAHALAPPPAIYNRNDRSARAAGV